mmetsp:Transcript_15189/g.39250  ORF Transcript_15189/g.39250 Transcript_15189/m.39250 type:complete len:87 (+) Transcript_15189:796-1056(+)
MQVVGLSAAGLEASVAPAGARFSPWTHLGRALAADFGLQNDWKWAHVSAHGGGGFDVEDHVLRSGHTTWLPSTAHPFESLASPPVP